MGILYKDKDSATSVESQSISPKQANKEDAFQEEEREARCSLEGARPPEERREGLCANWETEGKEAGPKEQTKSSRPSKRIIRMKIPCPCLLLMLFYYLVSIHFWI